MSPIEARATSDTLIAQRDVGVGLIGDIGATNARFALVLPGGKATRRGYARSTIIPRLPTRSTPI